VPGNCLVKGIVLREGIFFRVKTNDLRSGDDDAFCTVSFLKTSLLKNLDVRCCLGGVCAAATKTGSL
jgi:hypothetical protein